jgi:hypothetical protein
MQNFADGVHSEHESADVRATTDFLTKDGSENGGRSEGTPTTLKQKQ